MVRLRRTTKIDGKDYVTYIVIDDNEWKVLKANMNSVVNKDPNKGIKLEVVDLQDKIDDIDAVVPDDKATLEDYEELRVKGGKHYEKGEWSDALYFFEKAAAIKDSIWIKGRINKCVENLTPNKKENDKGNKKKPGRKPRSK